MTENDTAAVYEFNGMLHYPFPLSTGQIVTLDLPTIISVEDAERLSQFILGLASETAE